ncbi:MAG: hypothetical protein AB8B63_09805 [Granulosicoccus sp.]
MHITIIMVITYIVCCLRIATAPWKYWQLNARYFSSDTGIFSKLTLDTLIPERWRLSQSIDSEALEPQQFPVFYKPEWGQNAHGVYRVDDSEQLARLRMELSGEPQRYLLQRAAPGLREFELFSIDANPADGRHDIFTVTEAVNTRERHPVNSKFNRYTRYVDISNQFSEQQKIQLGNYLLEIGHFRISRLSVRADSLEALVEGNFHVIEINLFLPMPINLLDTSYTWRRRWRFIRNAMMCLARATRMIQPEEHPQPIFTRMMTYGKRKRGSWHANIARVGEHHTQI